MARNAGTRGWLAWPRAWLAATIAVVFLTLGLIPPGTHIADAQLLTFPARPKAPTRPGPGALTAIERRDPNQQMLVRANEINYDYTNQRVAAVGNVQIYYAGSTIEADRVIYDQKTKRLHAEGNVRLTEPDGTVTHSAILNLSDDYRDGFVDSLRVDGPEQVRFAAQRARRDVGNFTVFQSGVYTACEPCKDDPKKPPKWQVKAARIIHNQEEKMIYFEDARLEFFGIPLTYFPYLSTPDPTVKRKTGFLMPIFSANSVYGVGVMIPYYWAMAPNYDMTFSPIITSRQGVLMQHEWRHRLMTGSYVIRSAGIFQLDKNYFLEKGGPTSPGYRDLRGYIETQGQFALSGAWLWGWEGTIVSDRTFLQDYRLSKFAATQSIFSTVSADAISQLYLIGRGDRSYSEARAMHFYAFTDDLIQKQIPIVHPVIDHDYTLPQPVLGGELSLRANLTSLSRDTASFDPISSAAIAGSLCNLTADPMTKTAANCLLRGVPGVYSRFSTEANWKMTFIDSMGQVFTPFFSLRGDAATMKIDSQPGVSNYIPTGQSDVVRGMPTVGIEYRYPFISAHSWGTQTIEPIAQLIVRPNEPGIGRFPNEDAQTLLFDDTNIFRTNKFSGWDRLEGGTRVNYGLQYTAQVDRAGYFNLLVGQSYHLFGQNSFAVGGLTNTGLDSGLETARSDYVLRASYQPTAALMFTSRFRLDEQTFTVRRMELETAVGFGRWSATVLYGYYDAQPNIGFLTAREGVLATSRVKLTPNWQLLSAVRYDLRAEKISQTQIGIGYIDDCLILAVNYITDYAYSGSTTTNNTIMFQLGLRTLGGTSVGTSVNTLTSSFPGL